MTYNTPFSDARMGERSYRYQTRPRSPVYDPARASLPNGFGLSPLHTEHHLHVVPSSRREIIPGPRTSTSSILAGPITTTTYKVEPVRREGSRTRRTTLDSSSRPSLPNIVTAAPRQHHRPVIHSGGPRPGSPVRDPYRSSQEEYYTAIPATSRHHHHHQKRYSATMDNADMNRLARERESSKLRVEPVRGRDVVYSGSRPRPSYTVPVAQRHVDTVADDYGPDGYGYTNPRDLVQYDLNNNAPPARHHKRRDSFNEGRRERPSSITGYNDIAPRAYETRERGPPPSVRGFDRIPGRPHDWDQPQTRPLTIEPVPRPAPVRPFDPEPVQRPSSVRPYEPEPVPRPASVRPYDKPRDTREPELQRRSSSRRPVSLYHDREPRRSQREDYYETREEDPRRRSEKPRYEESVEQRHGASKRDIAKDEKKEHKTSSSIATGLSLAGAALGVKAFKDSVDAKDEREDRDAPSRRRRDYDEEEPRRRDYDEEPRRRDHGSEEPRRRDYENEEPRRRDNEVEESRRRPDVRNERDTDLSRDAPARRQSMTRDSDPRERRQSVSRDSDPRERRQSVSRGENRPSDFVDLSGREPRERRDREEPAPRQANSSVAVVDDEDDYPRRNAGGAGGKFNPKDTADLIALKAALNNADPTPTSAAPSTTLVRTPTRTPTRTPRQSMTRTSRELADVRSDLRIVPDPVSASTDKPVKGILRAPRPKFPEDPAPIREGVAPLKDAKKDGVPPDARWTKISRKLVNPEALEAGKERFEAREEFVIVLRVLTREEVQGYAEVTERIRAAREEAEAMEVSNARRRARRERHERHKRERGQRGERRRKEGSEESDTTEDEERRPKVKMLEGPSGGSGGSQGEAVMSGGLGR